ncbi:hypothetical protein BVX97_02655 [bacterium E08(2017)]|nr:hypothetical protein BVX97_02655 [bacterium E08(2017)]
MTSMWKEYQDDNWWRIQTDQQPIHRKLSRRRESELVGYGMNCTLWIYRLRIASHANAKRTFCRLTGLKPELNELKDVYEESSPYSAK